MPAANQHEQEITVYYVAYSIRPKWEWESAPRGASSTDLQFLIPQVILVLLSVDLLSWTGQKNVAGGERGGVEGEQKEEIFLCCVSPFPLGWRC